MKELFQRFFGPKAPNDVRTIRERIQAGEVQLSARESDSYMAFLKLDKNYFKRGDVVLDLGSGRSQNLARKLDSIGVETHSVDPSVADYDPASEGKFTFERRVVDGKFHRLAVVAEAKPQPPVVV